MALEPPGETLLTCPIRQVAAVHTADVRRSRVRYRGPRIERNTGGARMSAIGTELSAATAAAVEKAGRAVVRVEGRRRGPSSGIAWSADGVIVAAHHNLEWDEDIGIGLHDGTVAKASVIGRDPTTDIAVLRAPLSGL